MSDFIFYFTLGWQHIISADALDHQLFILALTAMYLAKEWRRVLVLVTAFTIGHSLTLALSVYDVVRISSHLVEVLIPCTIIATATANLFQKNFDGHNIHRNYFLALFFGLIHGLGFANTIRFMLAKGEGIGWHLFAFNAGLEAGQILVVGIILSAGYFIVTKFGFKRRWWVMALSIITIAFAIKFGLERI